MFKIIKKTFNKIIKKKDSSKEYNNKLTKIKTSNKHLLKEIIKKKIPPKIIEDYKKNILKINLEISNFSKKKVPASLILKKKQMKYNFNYYYFTKMMSVLIDSNRLKQNRSKYKELTKNTGVILRHISNIRNHRNIDYANEVLTKKINFVSKYINSNPILTYEIKKKMILEVIKLLLKDIGRDKYV